MENAQCSIVFIRDYRKIVMLVDFVLQNVSGVHWTSPVFFFIFLFTTRDGGWANPSLIMDSRDG